VSRLIIVMRGGRLSVRASHLDIVK
jgi:hypothetical protein